MALTTQNIAVQKIIVFENKAIETIQKSNTEENELKINEHQ